MNAPWWRLAERPHPTDSSAVPAQAASSDAGPATADWADLLPPFYD